jgi:hypothetical protein
MELVIGLDSDIEEWQSSAARSYSHATHDDVSKRMIELLWID